MARSLLTAVQSLGAKAERLAQQRQRLQEENKVLRRQVEHLLEENAALREERRRALLDVEFLTVSHRLADSPQKLADARRHIAGLIRILDRSIALLREDPKI